MKRGKKSRGVGGPPNKRKSQGNQQGSTPHSATSPASPTEHAAQPQQRSTVRSPHPVITTQLKSPLLDELTQSAHEIQISSEPSLPQAQRSKRVPMEYRAQAQGRCQRQRIKKPQPAPPDWRPDIQVWMDQWLERIDKSSPYLANASTDQYKVIPVQIDWRLISNSGVDEGIIRPVIGARGWPIIPGSSVKGLFRRSCPPDRILRWCGSSCASGELTPGILRFHGAWPANSDWMKRLLDVAHPQQKWQVGFNIDGEKTSAFGVVSLYQPRLLIGISSTDPHLEESEWDEIRNTMKIALQSGIGGRTCVGYGSSGLKGGHVVFECRLEGQGPAAKLLDGTPEFRPTMFRAAIRGMALRLFGGLTDPGTALRVVGELFGSLSREEGQHVGLLATAYNDSVVSLDQYGRGNMRQTVYFTSGLLQWRLTRSLDSSATKDLAELMAGLVGLTMSLGGFGRSWRRPDHRIFKPDYGKTPIGCHWQWLQPDLLPAWIHVQSPEELKSLLKSSRDVARRWLESRDYRPGRPAPWREVLHPKLTHIWTRMAKGPGDAKAVAWFHNAHSVGNSGAEQGDPRDLKHTILAGQMNQVGLIWNRLLPVLDMGEAPKDPAIQRPANPLARPANPNRPPQAMAPGQRHQDSIRAHQGDYLEILLLHSLPIDENPDSPQLYQRFIDAMNRGAGVGFSPVDWT